MIAKKTTKKPGSVSKRTVELGEIALHQVERAPSARDEDVLASRSLAVLGSNFAPQPTARRRLSTG